MHNTGRMVGTFGNVRRESFEVVGSKSVRTHFSEELLVEGQREWDVDDGEVVDGKTAQHADQEKVQSLFEAKRVEPGMVFQDIRIFFKFKLITVIFRLI